MVKVCGEKIPEAKYKSAVEAFKEISEEVLDEPTLKGSKAYLAVIKVKMKKPWVSMTSVSYKLKRESVLNIFANAFMEGELDDLFEVEVKEVDQCPK